MFSYCFCHVLMIFTGKKMHLSIKYNWSLWKGKNLGHHQILPWKTHMNEKKFLIEIVYIFSPFEKLWNTLQSFFQHYHPVTFMLIAIQNPFRLFIFIDILQARENIRKKYFLKSFIIYMYMYKENIFFSHRGEND